MEERHNENTLVQKMVLQIGRAREFLTDNLDRQSYADKYKCCPPPLFVPVITMLEIVSFVYYCEKGGTMTADGPVPFDSLLIYRPDRRIEVWRFFLYIFVHAGWVHLFFNMIIQIAVGIPLEMVHGPCRVAIIYFSGVLGGSLFTSVFDTNAILVGASGGVYALLAGHLANILLNYSCMELGFLKLVAVLFIASADVGYAVWDRYSLTSQQAPVGYTAHLMGALSGITVGLVVLKNFEQNMHGQYLWWLAFTVYLGCIFLAIFWNIFYY